jgi:cytochrome P450
MDRLPLPSNNKYRQAVQRLDETVYGFIRERRKSGRDPGDLLSMLLKAHDAEDGQMSDKQVRDEAMTLFLAGHETTANALTWTWYLLSQNPAVEERMHREIADAVPEGRLATVQDIPKLPFTSKVFQESIRLYPPAWALGRHVVKDTSIGGFLIPAGSTIVISQYVMHHDSRFYEDPEAFNPERWSPEMESRLPDFAYFPFGGGPRGCVGESFAKMEGVLILATIARSWRLAHVKGHRVELMPRITLRPKYGMRMKASRRRGTR